MEAPNYFFEFFMWMGPFKWPMIIVALLTLVLIVKKAIELSIPSLSNERKAAGVNAILYWGVFNMAFGFFGQTVSLWAALREIIAASDISPAIVLIGFYGSFVSTLFGTGNLIIAALAWWLFRYRLKLLTTDS
jgi:hypothetical protein